MMTLDFLVEMQKRGVIGSSAQFREIQENLRKGLGYEGKRRTTDLRAQEERRLKMKWKKIRYIRSTVMTRKK